MTNEAMANALKASSTLMRMVAAGREPISEPDVATRLRHWADQLQEMQRELINREAATRTLADTFKNWQALMEHGAHD